MSHRGQPAEQPDAEHGIGEVRELPPEIPAFNWKDRKSPIMVKRADPARYDNRSLNDIGDYLLSTEEVLSKPDFVFRGIRVGAEEYGGETIDGLCYASRIWYRYRIDDTGFSVPGKVSAEYRAHNTFMVYVDNKTMRIVFTSFTPCNLFGIPHDHIFEETLYDWRNDE